jgi:hypothetical protein
MFRTRLNCSLHRESHGHIHSDSVDKAIAILLEIFTLAFVLWHTTVHDLCNNTQRSNVALRRWLPSNLMYFWRSIITSEVKAFELVDIPGTTKVRNVEVPLIVAKDVIRVQIAVYDVHRIDVPHSFCQLMHRGVDEGVDNVDLHKFSIQPLLADMKRSALGFWIDFRLVLRWVSTELTRTSRGKRHSCLAPEVGSPVKSLMR